MKDGILNEEVHVKCPDCNGNLVFEGVKHTDEYFRCCICDGLFIKGDGKYMRVEK